jgi:pimeloyl-ACP methyl ester carboxylesterase
LALTERVKRWREAGEREEFRGQGIHVHAREGEDGPLLLLLHGFPSSSYDWRRLLDLESGRAALAFDFLGFGLSDKPRDHSYTLSWQADLTEELVARHGGGPVFICAHDMGTSVATELLARDQSGELGFEVTGALLFNGSMILELSQPTLAQRMLRGPLGPIAARLTSERFFRAQFGGIFSPEHPLTDAEEADQWALITHNDGQRLGHKLVHYMDERVTFAERWHGAIREWEGPISFAWGMLDPVATPKVLEGLRELRPQAPVTELADLGHYPQIEDPPRLAAALREAVSHAR